jgi:hypothetical protein
MNSEDFIARLRHNWKCVVAGDPEAEAEFWLTLTAGEEEIPALLDREAIAAWVTASIVQDARAAGVNYPEIEYRMRIERAASRLQHPFLLMLVADSVKASKKEDPITILDQMLKTFGSIST